MLYIFIEILSFKISRPVRVNILNFNSSNCKKNKLYRVYGRLFRVAHLHKNNTWTYIALFASKIQFSVSPLDNKPYNQKLWCAHNKYSSYLKKNNHYYISTKSNVLDKVVTLYVGVG